MDYLTTEAAGKQLGVTREAVRQWAMKGKIDAIRVHGSANGAKYAIPIEAVEAKRLERGFAT